MKYKITLLFCLILNVVSVALAQTEACYSTSEEFCQAPNVLIEPVAQFTLPGKFLIRFPDEDRLTLRVTTSDATFISAESTSTLVAESDNSRVWVSSEGQILVSDIMMAGTGFPGTSVRADIRVFNPNTTTELFSGQWTLVEFKGVTDTTILTLNPGTNFTQQTFLRFVNPTDSEAFVTLRPVDDIGNSGRTAEFMLAPQESLQFNSIDLEQGNEPKGLVGSFGTGQGKWRVRVVSDQKLYIHVLVRNADNGTLSMLEVIK